MSACPTQADLFTTLKKTVLTACVVMQLGKSFDDPMITTIGYQGVLAAMQLNDQGYAVISSIDTTPDHRLTLTFCENLPCTNHT